MQPTPPGWPTDLTVTEPRFAVEIDGVEYPSLVAQTNSEIATDVPEQVKGAPGSSVGSASATVNRPGKVETETPLPWMLGNEWIRDMFGKSCVIKAGYGDALVEVFSGNVAVTDGASDDRSVSLVGRGIGSWIRLETTIWPKAAVQVDNAGQDLYLGLTPLAILDELAAQAGYYSLPPAVPSTCIHTTGQSHMGPTVGTVRWSENETGWEAAPWGWGVWPTDNLDISYTSANVQHAMSDPPPNPSVTQMTVWTTADGGFVSNTRMSTATISTAPNWRLRIEPTQVRLTRQSNFPLGSEVNFLVIPGAIDPGPVTWQVNNTTDQMIITLPDGSVHTAAYTEGNSKINSIDLFGRFAGFTIADTNTGDNVLPPVPTLVSFEPTFIADPSAIDELPLSPFINQRVLWDVMREVAESEGGVVLATSDGKLRFKNRMTLIEGPPVATVTAKDVSRLDWTMSVDQLYTSVRVGYRPFEENRSSTKNMTVWSPEEPITLAPYTTFSGFYDLAYEMVFGMDTTITWVTTGWVIVGTVGYAWRSDDDGLYTGITTGRPYGSEIEFGLQHLEPGRIKLSLTWQPPSDPGAGVTMSLRQGSPIIRANQSFQWLDEASYVHNTGITINIGERQLEVPATQWRQTLKAAREWAEWLGKYVGFAQPIPQWFDIARPDPRLEIGDIVDVDAEDHTGLGTRALVMNVQNNMTSDGGIQQRLQLKLLHPVIADFNDVWPGMLIEDFNTFWAGAKIQDFNAHPLRS